MSTVLENTVWMTNIEKKIEKNSAWVPKGRMQNFFQFFFQYESWIQYFQYCTNNVIVIILPLIYEQVHKLYRIEINPVQFELTEQDWFQSCTVYELVDKSWSRRLRFKSILFTWQSSIRKYFWIGIIYKCSNINGNNEY